MKNYLYLFSIILLMSSCGASSTTPTVITKSVSAINFTSAISGGNVSSDGGDPITARGLCWSTIAGPTVSDSHTTESSDLFTSNMTGLSEGLTYYVRAYATNSIGTSYGNEEIFDTWRLSGTKWAFLLNYGVNNNNYPGDVDFFSDKTTKWDEPAFPGLYTTYGTWSVTNDILTYNFEGDIAATSYIFTSTIVNNVSMSGVFTWGTDPDKTFSATKY